MNARSDVKRHRRRFIVFAVAWLVITAVWIVSLYSNTLCKFSLFDRHFDLGCGRGIIFVNQSNLFVHASSDIHFVWLDGKYGLGLKSPKPFFAYDGNTMTESWDPRILVWPKRNALGFFLAAWNLPLWIPWTVLSLAVVCTRLRLRTPPGFCMRCQYDLTGNTTGICPECGTSSTRASSAAIRIGLCWTRVRTTLGHDVPQSLQRASPLPFGEIVHQGRVQLPSIRVSRRDFRK